MTVPPIDTARIVPVEAVRALADPTIDWPWNSIPPDDVTVDSMLNLAALDRPLTADETGGYSPLPHLQRIAWFMRRGWPDPITVDVGCPELGWAVPWPIVDRNHRLYSAILRGDMHIEVIVEGDVDHANQILRPDRPW